MTDPDFEIAVIGGGPGGSTLASYLARAGLDVCVLEAEHFPREHVGESLVPATTPVLHQIGALEKVDKGGFPRKYGAAWTSAAPHDIPRLGYQLDHGFRLADVEFNERQQPGVAQDYTYHVDRGEFDLLLLRHAESQGAVVEEGSRVLRVDLSNTVPALTVRRDGRESTVTANMVVDASGRQTMLGRQLDLKVPDPVFNQYAVHTWFENLDRQALATSDRQVDYIFIHFLPINDTWVWQIPITDTITSVGVVTQKARLKESGADRSTLFWDSVRHRPDLLAALESATRIRDFKTEGDYSYGMKQIVGDRWALIGDAARFVDPIFSSGVSVAMNSARLLSADIIAAAETGDYSRASFSTYEQTLRRGVRNWYEFISIYYRLNILFTAFVQDPTYRMDVLKMLQGDVYEDAEPRALTRMRKIVRAVESNPDHLWHGYLGALRAPTAAPLF